MADKFTILVTGGAGFIGSHTCLNLLNKGYELLVIDSLVNSSSESLTMVKNLHKNHNKKIKKLHFFKGDVRDKVFLKTIFKYANHIGKPIKGVIHFAGLKAIGESFKNPLKYWDFNFVGTLRLMETMKNFDCRTIIFSSSATLYGLPKINLINEHADIKPISPYGYSKATIEVLLKNLFDSEIGFWKIANLRYFNPIGAHDSGMIGENPIGIPNNIFPLITKVAAKEIDKLRIFGNDWNTKDGTCIRDYIHVMDLAEGHILSLEFLLKNESQLINLNLGTGIGTSVLELVNTFMQVNNVDVPFIFTKRREGDAETLTADNSLAYSLLNWRPSRSLEQMCLDGWRWKISYCKKQKT